MPISPFITQRIEQHLARTGMCIENLAGTGLTPDDIYEAVRDVGARHGREVSVVATPSGTLVTAVFPDWPNDTAGRTTDPTGQRCASE